MNFLPKDYEAPKTGGYYMKLQQGENKIRILSQPILGWEEWTKEKKPVRYAFDKKPTQPIDPKQPARHFWAFIVWNYQEEQIQVLQITQAGIRKGLESLCNDADWGAPFGYDIKIIKEGEDLKTKYTVNPLPHKPVAPHIKEAFDDRPCNLSSIFTNDDPFDCGPKYATKGMFVADMQVRNEAEALTQSDSGLITVAQEMELEGILGSCDAAYVKTFYETIRNAPICALKLSHVPVMFFEKLRGMALKNMAENEQKNGAWAI